MGPYPVWDRSENVTVCACVARIKGGDFVAAAQASGGYVAAAHDEIIPSDESNVVLGSGSHARMAKWMGRNRRYRISAVDVIPRPVDHGSKLLPCTKPPRISKDVLGQSLQDEDSDRCFALALSKAKYLGLMVGTIVSFGWPVWWDGKNAHEYIGSSDLDGDEIESIEPVSRTYPDAISHFVGNGSVPRYDRVHLGTVPRDLLLHVQCSS